MGSAVNPEEGQRNWDWGAIPDGRYFIEWYEDGHRRREAAGTTVARATEAHRRKRHQLEGITLGVVASSQQPVALPTERSLEKQIEHYLPRR
ncbi:MAG TPA: hypothetical protein VE621_08730 [Bryobacteraceae bacterium]|nr:hypothetical protein [Bryobacteraceae bacterium]